jgi:hypothetical protein
MYDRPCTQKADTRDDLCGNSTSIRFACRHQVRQHGEQRRTQGDENHGSKPCWLNLFFAFNTNNGAADDCSHDQGRIGGKGR